MHSWKFAANGVWEKALTIEAAKPIDIAPVTQWIMENPQNIAFEAIFARDNMPTTMFGLRISSLPKFEQALRIKNIVSKTNAIEAEPDFLKIVAHIFPEFSLFSQLKALNIGIIEQWYSFGPQTIWIPENNAPLSFEELEKTAPRFFEPTRNPAAVEFWYTEPTDHWYKI